MEWRRYPGDLRYAVAEDGTIVGPRGRALSQRVRDGYRRVTIGHSDVREVHSIVCETFHGLRPAGMQVAHGDGDRLNCHASNLSWKTPAGNADDRERHATTAAGERHGRARLTEDQVRAIRTDWQAGLSASSIARRYGISSRHAHRLGRGDYWKCLASQDADALH